MLAVSLLATFAASAYVAVTAASKDRTRFNNASDRTESLIRQRPGARKITDLHAVEGSFRKKSSAGLQRESGFRQCRGDIVERLADPPLHLKCPAQEEPDLARRLGLKHAVQQRATKKLRVGEPSGPS